MYAMIIGNCPFDGETREQIKEMVINKEVSFTKQKRLLETAKSGTVKNLVKESFVKAENDDTRH